MELVASEPLIASPSAVCWNERGRMFVSELHGYNLPGQLDIEELNKTGKLDTQVRRVQADEKFRFDPALCATLTAVRQSPIIAPEFQPPDNTSKVIVHL